MSSALSASFASPSHAVMPAHVQKLWSRERELATIVYTRGPSTAAEVQDRLSSPLTSPAVRSILTRLVAKGVLGCIPGRRGRGCPAIYRPKEMPEELRSRAMQQISDQYFGGSMIQVACAALRAAANEDLALDEFEIALKQLSGD